MGNDSLKGGVGEELDLGVGGLVEQNAKQRGVCKGCRNFYLEHFIFMSWPRGAFDSIDLLLDF